MIQRLKNLLKHIIPPPIRAFNREIERILAAIARQNKTIQQREQVLLETIAKQHEENQQSQSILLESIAQQRDESERREQSLLKAIAQQGEASKQREKTLLDATEQQQEKLEELRTVIGNSESQICRVMAEIENTENAISLMDGRLTQTMKMVQELRAHRINRDYYYYKNLHFSRYEEELTLWYEIKTKDTLDLEHPRTFNQKMQWLKLYDSTPLKTKLTDKYLVREWISDKIGSEYLVPLLGVWECFDDINFDMLPNQFVLKANHGSGWNLIVHDKSKIDMQKAKKDFGIWMHQSYAYRHGLELHYMNIKPRIIAEKYIENAGQLFDYKFMCFKGKIGMIWVDGDRYTGHKRLIKNLKWETENASVGNFSPFEDDILKPVNFEKMVEFSEVLSAEFACARIDFYEADDQLYFGEITFTSESGIARIRPRELELELGDMIQLPEKSPIPIPLFQRIKDS